MTFRDLTDLPAPPFSEEAAWVIEMPRFRLFFKGTKSTGSSISGGAIEDREELLVSLSSAEATAEDRFGRGVIWRLLLRVMRGDLADSASASFALSLEIRDVRIVTMSGLANME
jgi:hypothetical protein